MKILEMERRRRGLTQTKLGQRLTVNPSYIAHVEAGRWVPSPTSPAAKRLVRLFGRPLEELLQDVPEPVLATAGGKHRA